jgi:electron transfer flavoprotein alpha subunit
MLRIDKAKCISCEICLKKCPLGCIEIKDGFPIIQDNCIGCGICVEGCSSNAIEGAKKRSFRVDNSSYSGFWVLVQFDDNGKIKKASIELLSKARELSEKKKSMVTALVIRSDLNSEAFQLISHTGCDKILHIKNKDIDVYNTETYTMLIVKYILENKPEVVLFPATEMGRDLAPRVACLIQTGLTADCTGLELDEEGNLLQIRPTYGGNIMATILTPDSRPQMATVRPNVMRIIKKPNHAITTEIKTDDIIKTFDTLRFCKKVKNELSFADVSEASLVLAGGYGLHSAENFQLLYKIASRLNAAVGATRKVVDEGWAPSSIQVGQTGKTVAPGVYLAFGISGSLQHSIGMKESKKIIAINNDPAAPVFGFCDMAILGDAVEILKALYENI